MLETINWLTSKSITPKNFLLILKFKILNHCCFMSNVPLQLVTFEFLLALFVDTCKSQSFFSFCIVCTKLLFLCSSVCQFKGFLFLNHGRARALLTLQDEVYCIVHMKDKKMQLTLDVVRVDIDDNSNNHLHYLQDCDHHGNVLWNFHLHNLQMR